MLLERKMAARLDVRSGAELYHNFPTGSRFHERLSHERVLREPLLILDGSSRYVAFSDFIPQRGLRPESCPITAFHNRKPDYSRKGDYTSEWVQQLPEPGFSNRRLTIFSPSEPFDKVRPLLR
jgi:hypothetical protein